MATISQMTLVVRRRQAIIWNKDVLFTDIYMRH